MTGGRVFLFLCRISGVDERLIADNLLSLYLCFAALSGRSLISKYYL